MLIPAGYRIMLKMEEVEEKTVNGIILAQQTIDADNAAQEFGTVISMGEFCYREYKGPWVKVGQIVGIARYAGKVTIDPDTGEKFRMVNDLDIQCIKA